ncbi:MAG: hypothetical protein ACPLN0_01405 [Candidatus Hydrothermia bacterium]|jgi:hypothetical protein
MDLKRGIPLFLVFITGVLMTIQYFVPHPVSGVLYDYSISWSRAISSMAYVVAVISFLRFHTRRLKNKNYAPYSTVALLAFFSMVLIGFIGGTGKDSLFQTLYSNVMVPLQATTFSLLAFFMASAAYRAFRIRGLEATVLMITAFIVIIGTTTVGNYIPHSSEIVEWIMAVPNLASKRGILIGVGLGVVATSIKIILGIERSWVGG